MKRYLCVCFFPLLVLGSAGATDRSGVAGTWRGESICTIAASACHNEKVVYYIKDVPDHSKVLLIQADKIVNDRAITMGTGEWEYDRTQQTLELRLPEQVWLLKIDGNRIEGTLTKTNQTVYRKLTLQKDE